MSFIPGYTNIANMRFSDGIAEKYPPIGDRSAGGRYYQQIDTPERLYPALGKMAVAIMERFQPGLSANEKGNIILGELPQNHKLFEFIKPREVCT
jgi:hypothetical protein